MLAQALKGADYGNMQFYFGKTAQIQLRKSPNNEVQVPVVLPRSHFMFLYLPKMNLIDPSL